MARPASTRSRFDHHLEALHSRLSIAGWIVRAGGYTLLRSDRIKPASRARAKTSSNRSCEASCRRQWNVSPRYDALLVNPFSSSVL